MYADSLVKADKAEIEAEKGALTSFDSLFGEDVDLGVGSGPTDMSRQADVEMMNIVGPRLRRARKLAGYSESAAGLALAHKGVTQISLFENGHRAPSLNNLRLLANLYGVTVDYLLGLHDDIARQPEEGNQAVLCGVMAEAVGSQFHRMVDAMARTSSIMLEGFSLDRVLLGEVAGTVEELCTALDVAHRQPEFQDLKGGAKLVRLVGELRDSMKEQFKRLKRERMAMDELETVTVSPELIKQKVQQLLFDV